MIYPNLKVEMLRQGISLKDISNKLNVSLNCVYKKFTGRINFTVDEMFKIKALFNNNNALDYLFNKKEVDNPAKNTRLPKEEI